MSAVASYLAAFSPIPGEPDWRLAQRRCALAAFERTGFPPGRDELWRLTDLKPFMTRTFLPSQRSDPGKAAVLAGEAALLVPGAWRFVLADGVFSPSLSSLAGLPEGVALEPTHGRQYAQEASTSVFPDGIAALGVAFARDGFVLQVPAGRILEKPIHVISVQTEAGCGAHLLSWIDLAEGARAEVIESYVGGGQAWLNAAGHIRLAAGARLAHGVLVGSSEEAQVFSRFSVQVGKAAHYSGNSILAGAQQTRLSLTIDLAGDQAATDVTGLYLLSGRQRGQVLTEICHNGLATRTREIVKGVVDDAAHGIFQGKIVVTEGGQKSDAQMQSRTLLLSERARVDAKPELEIYADDVKCAHGATIGELDASAVFYLMARGLSQSEARRLLLRAFLEEVSDRIESSVVQAAFRAFLTRAFGAMAEAA